MFVINIIRREIPDLRLKLTLASGMILLYAILFVFFYPMVGNVIGAVSILAAVAIGFFVGLKYGAMFSILFIPLNFFLYSIFTDAFSSASIISTTIGSILTVISTAFAGMLSEFYNNEKINISIIKQEREKLREEILRRQEIEVELLETQRHLEKRVEERTKELTDTNRNLEDYKNRLEKIIDDRTNQVVAINNQLILENRKLSNAKLEINERNLFLNTLLNTIPTPVYIKDKFGSFIDCNFAYENFFNLKKSDIVGKKLLELNNNDYSRSIDEGEKKLLTNPIDREFEAIYIDPFGKTKNLLFNCSAFKKCEGEVEGIVGVIIDITELKHLERNKEIALEKEKDLNKLKTNFIAHASHQFRTPLSTILSSTELLMIAKERGLEMKFKEFHDMIIDSVDQLTSLLDDILTINRVDSGKLFKTAEMVDVVELVNSLLEKSKENCSKKINFAFFTNVKKFESEIDRNMIKLIFPQLLDNAINYSHEDGKVNVSLIKEDTDFKIIVEDFGIGIPEDSQENIFDAFYRGSNTANIDGTGLGLSIVKSTVEMFKGKVEFNSKLNTGSRFTITLPLQLN